MKDWQFFALAGSGYAASAVYLGMPLVGNHWFEPGSVSFELAKGLPAALVTLVIGAIAAYVAWQQWRVGHAKFKLELFDRRHKVYTATKQFLTNALNDSGPKPEFPNFGPEREEAAFLFGPDVTGYVEEVFDKVLTFWDILEEKNDLMTGTRLAPERLILRNDLRKWLRQQRTVGVHEKFAPYLDFGAWK